MTCEKCNKTYHYWSSSKGEEGIMVDRKIFLRWGQFRPPATQAVLEARLFWVEHFDYLYRFLVCPLCMFKIRFAPLGTVSRDS